MPKKPLLAVAGARRLAETHWGGIFLGLLLIVSLPGRAELVDVWRADDLETFDDGDFVGSWGSASNRLATGKAGELPVFIRDATPAGSSAVRFDRSLLKVADSPVGGETNFSIAMVFKVATNGANAGGAWYYKSGIIDAEQGGTMADWGLVIDQAGHVGIGTGGPDISTYSTGASLVDSNYHIAVFTWGGGAQRIFVDNLSPISRTGVATAARNNDGFTFGGIHSGAGGLTRRFVGDLVEVRFYDTALATQQVNTVMTELRETHMLANVPRIYSFKVNPGEIYYGASATLSWNVTNATAVIIDPDIGAVPATGSMQVNPTNTTTYTLVATNATARRVALATVVVDPGLPVVNDISTNTMMNAAVAVTFTGSDPNGGVLSYAVITPPSHGTLSGTPPNVTYTPAAGYYGLDAFTFKASDGMFESLPGTVSLKVIAPPMAPVGILLNTANIDSRAGPGAFIGFFRAIDPNENDTHTFALVPGAGDNGFFRLEDHRLFAGPSYTGGRGASFNIRVQTTDNTGRSFEQSLRLVVTETPENVVINEIHYNSPINAIREEFIELYNPADRPINLSYWRLRGGIDYYFPEGTLLPPHGYLVVTEDPSTLQARYGVTALGPWAGAINNDGEEIVLRDANNLDIDAVDFRAEFPWPIAADGEGGSMELVNPALDNNLGSSWRGGTVPTPGAINSVFATNAAPNIRQVKHTPQQPAASNQVVITCKVTDPEGVGQVQLHYQVVAPGGFIPAFLPLTTAQLNSMNNNRGLTNALNPAFEAATNWITVTMTDDGLQGDEVAGDSIYTAVLPPRAHRTLVRYRITVTDTLGWSRRAPFADDPSLNFAYYVYNGIPDYEGFSRDVLESLPVYSLITRSADIAQCTAWNNSSDQLPGSTGNDNEGRYHFNWEGAMVYEGVVYDHIRYRLRGANGRYHPGKRSFRFRFNQGHFLVAKDQHGTPFPTKWRELTTGKGHSNRGTETFALNEVINYFLWNKLDVPAPMTVHFHFRVVQNAAEAAGRYTGDFWGLNWAQEKYDVRFLEAHDLPKGNLYKLNDYKVDPMAEDRYFGPYAVTNGADFWNIQNNLNGSKTPDWLLAHVNYTNWYRYHAMCEAIRHYDFWPSANKNCAWYFEPIYTAANNYLGRFMVLPYDSTDTWGPTWNNGQDISWSGIFEGSGKTELQKEYRNTVREVRELLFQPDQIGAIIDAFAGQLKTFAPADYARWRNAPAPASYASISPGGPGVTSGLLAYAEDLKTFMFTGGTKNWWVGGESVPNGGWIKRLDTLATDAAVPARPTITYAGTNGYPADGLVFQSSAFADPQGSNTFGALQWRIAEVLAPDAVVSNTSQLKLEWDAAWTSGELTTWNPYIRVPAAAVQPEHLYRARVRHKDATGRWSRWSAPVEFRPGSADVTGALRESLVFSEIMYNPPSEGSVDGDEFEYLELKNIGAETLDLTGLFFSAGITFSFTNGTHLAPGQLFLLARNPAELKTRSPNAEVNGVYTGKLDNAGETISISHPHAGVVLSVTYDDRAPWPVTADGHGFSLVLADPAAGGYRVSDQLFGSPGQDGQASLIGGVVINEVLSSPSSQQKDAVELLNTSEAAVDISGWYLSDDPTYPWKYRFPAGTVLAAHAFAIFDEDDFNPTPGTGSSFSFSSYGDEVYLFSANANFQLTGYTYGHNFGAAPDGVSFGRHVNSVGEEQFPLQSALTLGAANAGPRIGPVVISEIHYHPIPAEDEFIELFNITANPVPLFHALQTSNTWKLSGLGYTFPPNTVLPANGYLLLVGGDPATFRARHGIPESVAILNYTGTLPDSGEHLELQAPDSLGINGVPYYAVDTVRFNDRSPWPVTADGAGASLHRREPNLYGNDPASWGAAKPTPGGPFIGGLAPVFTQNPLPVTVVAYLDAEFTAAASSQGPLVYQWRYNGTPIPGATNATLHLSNVQPSQEGWYDVVAINAANAVVSSNAQLTVLIPVKIAQQPRNATGRPGTNATFSVVATGDPAIRYQWRFNGVDIPGATNTDLSITNAQPAQDGNYQVNVANDFSSTLSEPARLMILVDPLFAAQPPHSFVTVGHTLQLPFALTNTATVPVTNRWRRNAAFYYTNSPVWSRADALVITNAQLTHAGTYMVVAYNASRPSGMNSSNAYVTVVDPPRDAILIPGANFTFSVSVGNPGSLAAPAPILFQWQHDSRDLTNAVANIVDAITNQVLVTTCTLTLTNVTPEQAGVYSVAVTVVTNAPNLRAVYAAGLRPGSATPGKLAIEIAQDGSRWLIFEAAARQAYALQFRRSMDDPWEAWTDITAAAETRLERIVAPQSGQQGFYRLIIPK